MIPFVFFSFKRAWQGFWRNAVMSLAATATMVLMLLLRINELGVTVMMATHNAEVVTALRKRVVALEEGRIIRDEVGGAYHRED